MHAARITLLRRGLIQLLCGLALAGATLCCAAAPGLHLGVLDEAPERPGAMLLRYEPLNTWLREHLAEDEIVLGPLVVAADPDMLAERLASGAVDLVLVSRIAALLLQRDLPTLTPVLLGWQGGEGEQKVVFFTARDSQIELMTDLRGQTLALASANAQAGGFVPRITLEQLRIAAQPRDASDSDGTAVHYQFVGSALNQAYWVVRGRAAAGAFSELDWDVLPEHLRVALRIFKRTKGIVPYVLLVSERVPPAVRQRLIAALVDMESDPHARTVMESVGLTRFQPPHEDDTEQSRYWRAAIEQVGL